MVVIALMCAWIGAAAAADLAAPSTIFADPAPDPKFPAQMVPVTIVSKGDAMNGVLYVASGQEPHPTVLLLHGLPGNEQNLDLAQAIRRAGWNVLTFRYRGSWGSHGEFSVSNAIEDAASALAFLRDVRSVEKYSIDPNRLVIVGHSMGGFVAAKIAVDDQSIDRVVLIAAANMGPYLTGLRSPSARQASLDGLAAELAPLGGATVESLLKDSVGHDTDWDFTTYALALKSRRVLIVTADDGLTRSSQRLAQQLLMEGSAVELVHIAADHSFSSHRIALQATVLNWLQTRINSPPP
jgi:pimeloyl-ACP methyl ester carboxylesterase